MAAERGCDTQPLYREMKQAVQPLLCADPDRWREWELEPKKLTSSAMAAAIAEREVQKIKNHGSRYLPDKTVTHKGVSRAKR